MSKIKYGGYGTSSADYYTIKLGNMNVGAINRTSEKAETEAKDLANRYPGSTITIVGHKDPKKARVEANKRPWEGKNYYLEVHRYKGLPASVGLWRRNGSGLVKRVTVHDLGQLFQYDINKRQMDFLDRIKKEAGVA